MQVVGLTASPGAGSARTVEMAVEHILELCANMDTTEISTVRDRDKLAEMMNHIQQANEGAVVFVYTHVQLSVDRSRIYLVSRRVVGPTENL